MTLDWQAIQDPMMATIPYVVFVIIAVGVIQNLFYLFQLVVAWWALHRKPSILESAEAWWKLSDAALPIAILAPAYNEEVTIVDSVRSLLALHYPNFQVIVINDGSADRTLDELQGAFELEPAAVAFDEAVPHLPIRGIFKSSVQPRLLVVDKENGGKADALNAGINVARAPLFCAVDADSLLEADSLIRVVEAFMEDTDRVKAVGGTIRLANGCKVQSGRVMSIGLPRNPVAMFQIIEYLRAFLMGRLAWSALGALMLISGAFGIFRRSAAVAVGGYSHGTVGEDMEIIVKMHRYFREENMDYEIRFIPEPVCWTEAPESLKVLGRQRKRWQRGALETFFKHIRMLGNPRYGIAGTVGFVHVLITDVIAPVVEVLGYFLMPVFWLTGTLSLDFFLAYLALAFNFGVFISVGSLILEEMELKRFPTPKDLALLMVAAVLENFGYRQLNNIWRIMGWWQFLRGEKGWGRMTRIGFQKS